jgi:hypothetical protein
VNAPGSVAAAQPRPERNWIAIGAIATAIGSLVAAVSLVVALAFNGIQLRAARDAVRQSRDATELQVFTQLNALVNDSVERFSPSAKEWSSKQLTDSDAQTLSLAVNNGEYLAWLFNDGYIHLAGARALWGPVMRCLYNDVAHFGYAQYAPNLTRFAKSQRCNA